MLRAKRRREKDRTVDKQTKTQFIENLYCNGKRIGLEGSQIMEKNSHVYSGFSLNTENDLKEELHERRRALCAAFGPLMDAMDQQTDPELNAHLIDPWFFLHTVDAAATSKTLRTIHFADGSGLLRYKSYSSSSRLCSLDLRISS